MAVNCQFLARWVQGTKDCKATGRRECLIHKTGVHKFLKKYEEYDTIGKQEGAGRKRKITAGVRRLVH